MADHVGVKKVDKFFFQGGQIKQDRMKAYK